MEHREPHGCFLKSLAVKDMPAEGVRDYNACNFLAENFVTASCEIERETHLAVRNVIRPQDVVLEIGGRYGTTSCEVSEVKCCQKSDFFGPRQEVSILVKKLCVHLKFCHRSQESFRL